MPVLPDNRIRVLCVDDHVVVRDGLSAIINRHPDMNVVAVAGSAGEAIDQYERHHPDVTLMDLRLPDASGFEAIHRIRRLDPRARIVVLTMYEGDVDIRRALEAGAAAYLMKKTVAVHLIRTIREVYAAATAPPVPNNIADEGSTLLSPREVDVMERVAQGLRDKEISASLGISEETVGAHMRRIFTKLEVHDRTSALMAAIRLGIIHTD